MATSTTLSSFLSATFPEYKSPPPARLKSLYSDVFRQKESNPEGYRSSLAWWTNTLQQLAQAGHQPTSDDKLVLHADDALLESLRWQSAGRPLGLGSIVVRRLLTSNITSFG
jgi:charged multivesicular body protein 7